MNMIFKVFYQERKDRSPKREQTKVLYLEVTAPSELDGLIKTRQIIAENTAYNVEHIEYLSDKHLAYEKETGAFSLTEF